MDAKSRNYTGGKFGSGTYQTIINQIPPHEIYIEPYLGTGGIMRRIKPARRRIGVDSDQFVLWEHWTCGVSLGGSYCGVESDFIELHHADAVPWLSWFFQLDASEADPADRYGVAAWSDVFVYLDPPYVRSTRADPERDYYRFEMTDDDHAELLMLALQLPCNVMISGYWSQLYADLLRDWRTVQFQASTRGGMKTECLWMNYDEPTALHDYRFLGNDRREREKIRRVRRRWIARLKRMPPLERQAILQAFQNLQ